jgi:virginiamycin B lyase
VTRAHLATCARCQARLREYTALRHALQTHFGAPAEVASQFNPFSLSAIIAAERLDDTADSSAEAQVPDQTGASRSARVATPQRSLVSLGRRLRATRGELVAVAAVLFVALVASLLFSTLRPLTSILNGPHIVEFTTAVKNGQQVSIALGPDGNLWYTDIEVDQIVRITPTGALTVFSLPRGSEPLGIAAGPDDALWFTEATANKIGRITTSGAITTYPLPHAGSWPTDITPGPDGALWFTERNANQIGRITTTGAISEYPLLSANSLPSAITLGPDGALWFIQSGSSQIGRLAPNGSMSEVSDPGVANDITTGPDGDLWFTAEGAIGRLTPQGSVTLFKLANPFITPGGIASGPDGALWFTEYSETQPIYCDGHTIGRITTTGAITTYPLSAPDACPAAITSSYGALWFMETGAGKLGKITP